MRLKSKMLLTLLLCCISFSNVNTSNLPNLGGMTLPANFQKYHFDSRLSMGAGADWVFLDSAVKTSENKFSLVDGTFGFVHTSDNIPPGTFNFRMEVDISSNYSTNCGSFGLMLFKETSVPWLTRILGVNRISSTSGLILIQDLCQNGSLNVYFNDKVNAFATDVSKLGGQLPTLCSHCQAVTSSSSSANYQMIIQVVDNLLTVSYNIFTVFVAIWKTYLPQHTRIFTK